MAVDGSGRNRIGCIRIRLGEWRVPGAQRERLTRHHELQLTLEHVHELFSRVLQRLGAAAGPRLDRGARAGDVELTVRPGDTGEVDAGVRGVDRPLLAVGRADRRVGGLLLHEVRHRLAERPGDLQERRDRRHHAALLDRTRAAELRRSVGAAARPLVLSVGGIEPRKGSDTLVRALAVLAREGLRPVLAVVGGHSFQDHRAYREAVLAELPVLGLELGVDVVPVGTVADDDMSAWYADADILAFPSVKEGFGLAVLEAMSAGVPVVTSDLPVFREYLVGGREQCADRSSDSWPRKPLWGLHGYGE